MIFARVISLKEDGMSQELAPLINQQTIERFQRDGAVHLAGVFDDWLAMLEVIYLIKKSVQRVGLLMKASMRMIVSLWIFRLFTPNPTTY